MIINKIKTSKGCYAVLLFILGVHFSCTAQRKESVKKENPPGTIWLKDNLYIDRVPISNVYYREYEYYNRKYAKYNFSQLDSLVNLLPYFGYDGFSFTKNVVFTPNPDSDRYKIDINKVQSEIGSPFFLQYLKNPAYNFYPITNMPYQAAESFCQWRTAMIMSHFSSTKTKSKRDHNHKKIKYRLPTKEEWEYAVTHLPSKFSFNDNINFSGRGGITQSINDSIYGKHNYSDKYFFLNDLSEIVAEKNVAKGRNWKDSTSWKNINFTTSYQDACNWLTFRCVCEVED